MFGWRKKRDGFEWRRYVRTTILVRRQHRQAKLDEAREAALQQLAEAGRAGKAAGMSGVGAAKKGLSAAGRSSLEVGKKLGRQLFQAGRVAGHHIKHGAMAGGRAVGKGAQFAGKGLALGAKRAAESAAKIGKSAGAGLAGAPSAAEALYPSEGFSGLLKAISPRTAIVLAVILAILGVIAAALAGYEAFTAGFDWLAIGAAILAVILLGLAAMSLATSGVSWAWPEAEQPDPLTIRPKRSVASDISDVAGSYTGIGLAALLLVAATAGFGWLFMPKLSLPVISLPEATVPTVSAPTDVVTGKAKALTGDIMMVGDTKIVLKGIEAPDIRQYCKTSSGRRWSCGRDALNALRRVTGYDTLECTVDGADKSGRKLADCVIGEKNIAAELVRQGHAFARGGFFTTYGKEEQEAREAKRGIWKGTAQARAEFRTERWQKALRKSPDGCPIKGKSRARSRDNVYILPWSASYRNYKISKRRGDRWFCSEGEAVSAGWKPLDR